MSVKMFIVSCLFPTPFMLYYMIIEIRRRIHLLYLCRDKQLSLTIPVEILASGGKSLDSKINIDTYAGPQGLDIPFIDEDSNHDECSDST